MEGGGGCTPVFQMNPTAKEREGVGGLCYPPLSTQASQPIIYMYMIYDTISFENLIIFI